MKRHGGTFEHIHVKQERRAITEAGAESRRRGGSGVCAVHRPDEHGDWHVCPESDVDGYAGHGMIITVYRD